MLGKYRVVSIVLLSICLASCGQQKNTQETTIQESVTTVEQSQTTNFQLGKGSNQFNTVSFNETFRDKSVVAHYEMSIQTLFRKCCQKMENYTAVWIMLEFWKLI